MIKTAHAFAFVSLGSLMQILPVVLPNQFPPSALGIENTSALWIRFMGWVNFSFGTGWLLTLHVWPGLVRLCAWRPAMPRTVRTVRALRAAVPRLPNTILRPAWRLEPRVAAAAISRRQPIRVNVHAGNDQRAAA